ncbi:AAA family ATPase [Paraburkholderia sp. Tr-20389]|uniref:ATP-binding protein n=1 Tax=Paraburkholderia sp. Tr-20389 TaxID=2703903 RepID=UPI001981BB3A|nr:ATP-binding protein [Paraburkholderia sp. Tr-20389]MBN3756237.1 AAA family ATPase [Paraburkholderia sp. Tr-20389]
MTTRKPKLTSREALDAAFGPNPLLDPLDPLIEVERMPAALSHRPLQNVPWRDVDPKQRIDFLNLMQSQFVPTPDAVEIALAIQQMIRASYIERHPALPCNRRRRMEIATLDPAKLPSASWFPGFARAVIVEGITGLGKTFMKDRILSLYPQVHRHGRFEAGGWEKQAQIIYLDVTMSADSSRLGFLDNILLAIDNALRDIDDPSGDTHYYETYGGPKSRMSTEKVMVIIGQILSQYYCGLLVIDEIQDRNFSTNRELILLFFLRLLNFGIPIMLLGNPKGFSGFEQSAQDTRRLYKGGHFELWPATDGRDRAWRSYVSGKLQDNLLPLSFPVDDTAHDEFYRCSGGVRDYFDTLLGAMQERGLRKNLGEIPFEYIAETYSGRRMKKYHGTINALVKKDINELAKNTDMPLELFAKRWKMSLPASESSSATTLSDNPGVAGNEAFGKGAKKANQTRYKSPEQRRKQADAMFRKRQDHAANAQQAAQDAKSPMSDQDQTEINRAELVARAKELARVTSKK